MDNLLYNQKVMMRALEKISAGALFGFEANAWKDTATAFGITAAVLVTAAGITVATGGTDLLVATLAPCLEASGLLSTEALGAETGAIIEESQSLAGILDLMENEIYPNWFS